MDNYRFNSNINTNNSPKLVQKYGLATGHDLKNSFFKLSKYEFDKKNRNSFEEIHTEDLYVDNYVLKVWVYFKLVFVLFIFIGLVVWLKASLRNDDRNREKKQKKKLNKKI